MWLTRRFTLCKPSTAIHNSYAWDREDTRKMEQVKFSYSVFEKVGGGVTHASQWKFDEMKLIILIIN